MRTILVTVAVSIVASMAAATTTADSSELVRVLTMQGNDDRGQFVIRYPALTPAFPDAAIREKVNAEIKAIADDYICLPDLDNRSRMSSETSVKVFVASAKVLSFQLNFNYECGGAYPDTGSKAWLFDLTDGQPISIEDQVLDMGAMTDIIVSAFLASIPLESGGCEELYTEEDFRGIGYKYSFTKEHLVVTQDYPHVARACEYEVRVSYSELNGIAKPGTILSDFSQGG